MFLIDILFVFLWVSKKYQGFGNKTGSSIIFLKKVLKYLNVLHEAFLVL